MLKRIIPILCVALASTACASFPVPTETLAESQASIRAAEELGAAEVPAAGLELQLASEALAKAERLMADGENEWAHYMALRATNDAELAIALVREALARDEAQRAKAALEATKAEVTP